MTKAYQQGTRLPRMGTASRRLLILCLILFICWGSAGLLELVFFLIQGLEIFSGGGRINHHLFKYCKGEHNETE